MHELTFILVLTLVAGLAMPAGAALACFEHIRPRWLENELRHTVVAFGGGALLSAVALVLVPESIDSLNQLLALLCFASGGAVFMFLDIFLAKRKTSAGQLVAMLADFIPEAIALGATFTVSTSGGLLLAIIITLQNLPEGFNSYREIKSSTGMQGPKIILLFAFMALLGPVSGLVGYTLLAESHIVIAGIMMFAAGGILYIVFQDIAPQVRLRNHWAPPLGAVAGFGLGILGKMLVV
ncbi:MULTISPECIES: ZIP family metal transporter [Gammaproteobacteria]|uniref:ZIP family metal transporter n=1 Tax=Gammaproteobacteria TaxID=1236 RepID=UPI000DD06293|nr:MULTISPECIES: ZIP family metal transporter [Gammaproteobacteria]RTE86917.1 divalent cation transporter [Aliidiomarina sp. B3213]TCZ93293.1 divalent cation transporter [Lysobacter sp. N42]